VWDVTLLRSGAVFALGTYPVPFVTIVQNAKELGTVLHVRCWGVEVCQLKLPPPVVTA
jgi:hypothetical protein